MSSGQPGARLMQSPPAAYGSPSEPLWSQKHYFPKFPPPHDLSVVDLRDSADTLALTLLSLQGIVNREDPRIYIILDKYSEFWLQYAQSKVGIHATRIDSPGDLITQFKPAIKGIVVYDPTVPDTINVATTIAGLDDRVISDPNSLPNLQQRLGTTDILDLRENVRRLGWSNSPSGRASIYEWVYDNLWPRCERRMIGVANPGPPVSNYPIMLGVRDYIVALRLVTLYLSPDDPTLLALYKRFLSTAETPIPVFGWVENEEDEAVSLASSYGDWVPVLSHIYQQKYPADLTVLSGIDVEPVRYHPRIDDRRVLATAQPGVYVTAYVSDGDNMGYDFSLGGDHWSEYSSSEVPIGWTINPVLVDVAPLVWNYYMMSGDAATFVAGASGAGYMEPENMSLSRLRTYLEYARGYWETTGLRTAQVLGWTDQAAQAYSEELAPLGLFNGYYSSLNPNMLPFSLNTEPEIFFHYVSNMPIAMNAYSFSDWSQAEVVDNLLNIVNGREPTKPVIYSASSLSGFGEVVKDQTSKSGTVRVGYANKQYTGSLVYGPYVTLPPGTFQAAFRLKTSNVKQPGHIAALDVATGERILTHKDVSVSDFTPDSWRDFNVTFTTHAVTNDIEFRVTFVSGSTDLYADTITLMKTDAWPIEKREPVFVVLAIISSDDVKQTVRFLEQLESLDPRIHLLSTDEFLASLNPSYLQDLTQAVLKEADPKLVPASVMEKVSDADSLLSMGRMGDYLAATRNIFENTTAELHIQVNPRDAGVLTPSPGLYAVPLGSTVTVSQQPIVGHEFSGWTLDGKDITTNATTIITMDSKHNLTAAYHGTSTTSTAPTTAASTWGVPGFSIESILAGLAAGVALLKVLRHRRRRRSQLGFVASSPSFKSNESSSKSEQPKERAR
jgi:hypothetical protein